MCYCCSSHVRIYYMHQVHMRYNILNHLLLVYFGSVDLSLLNLCNCDGLLVIVEHHLPHQHHQFMQVLPWLQHKVTRVAGRWHKHIHILTRLKVDKKGYIIIHVDTRVDTALVVVRIISVVCSLRYTCFIVVSCYLLLCIFSK